uniref:Proteasomal ubiquitin receptor ADRM1 homolog n=1 Tax=Romanomermis culicivorax TaxID=13658 RepID=A0A915JZ89_ROMCU
MALFSNNAQPQSSNLVEFMAGKMFTRDKMVCPDSRKGKIYLYQSEDGLMHFCWKDASSNVVEDDLIIFPDDAKFTKVGQCTTGRVYLLSFKNPPRKLFYWMQAFKDDKDDEHCKRVNDLLNNPPVPGVESRSRGGAGTGGIGDQLSMVNQLLSSGSGGEDLQRALQGVDRRQMMQLLNLMGAGSGAGLSDLFGGEQGSPAGASTGRRLPVVGSANSRTGGTRPPTASTATPAASGSTTTAAANPPTRQITTAELSQILSGMNSSGRDGTPREDVELEKILTAKNIEPVLNASAKYVERLKRHLPKEQPIEQDEKEVLATLRTPQFRQGVGIFGVALHSGQLAPLMQQFGFSSDVVKAFGKGDVQSVAEVLQQESTASQAASGPGGSSNNDKPNGEKKAEKVDKAKKDDDPMDLD